MNLFKNQKGFSEVITVVILTGFIGAIFITGVFVWQEYNLQNEVENMLRTLEIKQRVENIGVKAGGNNLVIFEDKILNYSFEYDSNIYNVSSGQEDSAKSAIYTELYPLEGTSLNSAIFFVVRNNYDKTEGAYPESPAYFLEDSNSFVFPNYFLGDIQDFIYENNSYYIVYGTNKSKHPIKTLDIDDFNGIIIDGIVFEHGGFRLGEGLGYLALMKFNNNKDYGAVNIGYNEKYLNLEEFVNFLKTIKKVE
jgi:hypothetical protein